jgi:hypothetical protein
MTTLLGDQNQAKSVFSLQATLPKGGPQVPALT